MTDQNNYINFNKKTVFVVGAGASLPYGYPLGAELVDKVIEAAEKRENDKQAKELIKRIKFHDPLSIDSFLAQHCADDEELTNIGKQLIAECILECEDREAILEKGKQFVYNPATKKYDARGNENWYRYLAHAMFEDKERLINKPLPFKIITFNYDVSLDYYLLERVWKAFEYDKATAKKILAKLSKAIIHVYGAVREVPWDNPEALDKFKICRLPPIDTSTFYIQSLDGDKEENHIKYVYGSHNTREKDVIQTKNPCSSSDKMIMNTENGKELMQSAAKNIDVIGRNQEKIEENLKPFKQYIAEEAQRIMFLGFGFDNQNMKLLFNADYIFKRRGQTGIKIEVCYTNYDDSEKLKRRLYTYFPEKYGDKYYGSILSYYKSIKGVYEALTQDFDLD